MPSSLPNDAVPDGLAVDAAGCVWVAFWGGGAVGCFAAGSGSLRTLISLPVSRPTCVAFGGPQLDTLFVTSCRQDKGEDADLSATEPLAGCVFAIRGTGEAAPRPQRPAHPGGSPQMQYTLWRPHAPLTTPSSTLMRSAEGRPL